MQTVRSQERRGNSSDEVNVDARREFWVIGRDSGWLQYWQRAEIRPEATFSMKTRLIVSFAFILSLQLDYYIYIYLILRILFSIGIYSFCLRNISFKQLCEAFVGKAYSTTIAWKAIFDMLRTWYFQKVILSHIVINCCKRDKVAEVSELEGYGNLPGKPNTLR